MPFNEEGAKSALIQLLQTVQKLRAPDGCPWDREQTHQSLRPFLVEETYETLEILDQIKSAEDLLKPDLRKAFIEEFGDVLLQILLHAEIASENQPSISFEQIASSLSEKLVRRHPHVFGDIQAKDSEEVLKNWEQIKKEEKGLNNPTQSVFDSIPKGTPPLVRTMKVIQKVTRVGFQWPDLSGPMDKLIEETQELKQAITQTERAPEDFIKRVQDEIGDVLFSACNIAYFLKIDPDSALRDTLRKFESRFRFVEQELKKQGKTPEQSNLEEMDALWSEAKKVEAGR